MGAWLVVCQNSIHVLCVAYGIHILANILDKAALHTALVSTRHMLIKDCGGGITAWSIGNGLPVLLPRSSAVTPEHFIKKTLPMHFLANKFTVMQSMVSRSDLGRLELWKGCEHHVSCTNTRHLECRKLRRKRRRKIGKKMIKNYG